MAERLGRYELLEEIGQGGFAIVYRARDTALDRDVALKELKPVMLRDPTWVDRFRREAKVIARLDHPGIVPVYDVGDTADRLFIVMRLVNGPSLADLITTQERLSWAAALEIANVVAGALDYAHSQGVLHRDIKPANILVDPDRGPLLSDFGMAKLAGESGPSLSGDIFGTPHYIAPETWEGQPVTSQADIFALGCIIYEMLEGQKLFPGDTPLAVLNAHQKPLALPDIWPEDVPAGLADVLRTALAKNPSERYPRASDMAGALIALEPVAPGTKISGTSQDSVPLVLIQPPVVESGITLPPFLAEAGAQPAVDQPVFVARERELTALDEYLSAAMNGNGQVVFVTGEAGHGKTSLVREFSRRAQATYPELIVTSGNCNAYSGLGDPYLPFREAMAVLAGDVESKWRAGTIGTEHARRLWQLMPFTAQLIAEECPNLIDIFVPGSALVRRVTSSQNDGPDWWERLREAVEQRRRVGAMEQGRLFEQYTRVLQSVATRQPLLLLLDDLQWADSASISLLFHLGRQLTGHRILVIAAYRPTDLLADSTQQHPLLAAINEFKRLFGEIELDLGQLPPGEGRVFVDALLDSERNQLGEKFRAALFRQTQGQPLFTVELLREMQERGDLVRDEAGRWTETEHLEWRDLPARVEAVIEQRLNRLDENTQDMLAIAAVEGEVFTVQVVARLHDVNERKLLRQLSRTLGRQHQLVSEQDEVTVGDQTLSRFQFRHALFQQYLYNQLSPGERRLLHTDVAAVLEELYVGHTEEIAVALARHYTEAGQGEKAIPHLLRAGDQARLAYAHEAAIAHYRQAVTFLKEREDDARTADTLMKLGLTYHNAFDFERSRQAYDEAFTLRQKVGQGSPVLSRIPTPQVLRLVISTIPTLDPTKANDDSSGMIIDQLFSGLVEITPEMEVVPDVARRWEILNDGKKYVFYLRDDVFWSDGTPLTAADFEYAWKRVLSPSANSPAANLLFDVKGAEAFHQREAVTPDQIGVSALDKHTLVVELAAPASYFLHLLTNYVTYPVPRHVVIHHGDAWTEVGNIATNGPFKLEAWPTRESLILTRNPDYHRPFTGNVQRVEIFVTAEWSPTVAMYDSSLLDSLFLTRGTFLPEEVVSLRQRYLQDYVRRSVMSTICLNFNVHKPPFNDDRIRRALALAIDKESLATVTMNGLAGPAHGGFIPPGMPGHSTSIGLPFEPDQARRLLAEAGYPNGQGFPAVTWLTNLARIPICEYLQRQWHNILGIKIEWESVVWAEYNSTIRRIQPHLFMGGWRADYPDPDNFSRVGIPAETGWHNETYIDLVDQARRITDRDTRMELYAKADQLLIEEVPLLPLLYPQDHLLIKPWLTKFPATLTNSWVLKDALIDPARQPEPPHPTSLPPEVSRTLRIGGGIQPPTLDWAKFEDSFLDILVHQLFSRLVKLTSEMELVPDLAQRWEILEGGQKYIFHLRRDAFWSDSIPVTAGDFEYAWKRILDPATTVDNVQLLYDIKGARAFHQGKIADPGQIGVYALNDLTLVVELEKPTGYFLYLLTNTITCPIPRHVVTAFPDAWTDVDKIVTNGSFQLSSWDPDGRVRLTRNPTYHGKFGGNVTQLEFVGREEPSAIIELFAGDELDIVNFPVPQLKQVLQKYSENYLSTPALAVSLVDFDVNRPPFNDPRVRRAFVLAVDKNRLVSEVNQNTATPATGGLVPAGMPGHSADIGGPYDPDQARQLLAEAGYPGGKNFPVIDFLIWPRRVPHGEFLVTRWREILGVNIRLDIVPWTNVFERRERSPAHLHLIGWLADYPDPDDFLRVAFSSELRWRNERYNRLVAEAGQLMDQQERLALYRQADRMLIDAAAILPLTYPPWHLLVKPWVKKLSQSAAGWWHFENVIIGPDQ